MIINTDYPPPASIVRAIGAATTRTSGRVEIYEQDGTTRWEGDSITRLIEGSVSVDYSRDERRTLDLTLDNKDDGLLNAPGEFWYDKVIKVFKRVTLKTKTFDAWDYQIGEFMIDSIGEDNFPHQTKIAGRDYTKKCLLSEYVVTTQYSGSYGLEDLVGAIAANAGVVKQILPVTGITVTKTFSYEPGATRWQSMKDIANAYNYDVFLDPQGYLRMQLFPDPFTQQPAFTFLTGPDGGNLASYSKSSDDSQLFNHVIVTGATPDSGGLPVWAEAKNEVVGSPTSIAEIGDRVYPYQSDVITTVPQAQSVADSFLAVYGLEQFNLDLNALNHFYLEVGLTISFIDPRPAPNDPTNFLLQTMTIPIGLGTMDVTAARIEEVG